MVTDESCYNTQHEKGQELSDDFGIFNDRQQLEKAGPMKPLSLNLQEQKLTADASQNGMDVVSARDDGAEEYIPDEKVENTTKSMARSISQPCIDARTKLNNDHPRPTNALDLRNDIIDSISPIGRDGLPGFRSIMNGVSTKMNSKRFETIPSRTPLNTIQVTTSRYLPVSRLISSSSSSESSKFRFDGQVIDNPRSIGSSANFSSMSYHPYYSYTGQQSPIQPPTHQNYVGGTYLNLGTMGQFYSALPRDFGFNPVLVEPLPVSTPINTAGPSSSALPNAASANYYNEDPNAANASAQKKKYVCTICQKRFARPSSLEQHIRAHTGEKPYACNFPGCSKRFSIMSNLRRHHKIHGADAQEYLNQQLSASSGAPRSAAVSSNNTSSDPDFSASGYSPNLASADNNPAANAF